MTQIPEIVERLSPLLLELHDYIHLLRIKDFFSWVFPLPCTYHTGLLLTRAALLY